jgi:8-oxo-dGTP pyrophosphatase MutT (NUDIX family)
MEKSTIEIHVLARAVIIKEGHILLAYDSRDTPYHYYELNVPFYYLPGGHIEFKESAPQAVLREIEEETGYRAQYEGFLGVLEHSWHFPGDEVCCHTHEVNLIFKVHLPDIDTQINIVQIEEHVAFKWVPLKAIEKVDLRPAPLKRLLPKWLEHTHDDVFESFMK